MYSSEIFERPGLFPFLGAPVTNPGYSPLMEALRLAPGKGTLIVLHSGTVTHWKNAMNIEISLEVKKFFSWVAHGIYLLISHVLIGSLMLS